MAITLNGSTGISTPGVTNSGAETIATTLAVTGATTMASTLAVSGNLSFNSGYGSAAVAYGCRAWVNFNGTGTVAIRASGNVSSITDNGTGDYTVNFTTAMPDANYAPITVSDADGPEGRFSCCTNRATGSVRIVTEWTNNSAYDSYVYTAIFR